MYPFPVLPKGKANSSKHKNTDFIEEGSQPTYLDMSQESEMKKGIKSKNLYRFRAVE